MNLVSVLSALFVLAAPVAALLWLRASRCARARRQREQEHRALDHFRGVLQSHVARRLDRRPDRRVGRVIDPTRAQSEPGCPQPGSPRSAPARSSP